MSARSKTDPGPPTPHDVGYKGEDRPNEALLDRALEAVPRRLAPVAVESQDSAGQQAARYRAEPKVLPRGIDTLPPQEAVIVQTQRDFPTDPTSRNVDNRPPPATTDPMRSIRKPPLWPVAVGLVVLIALIAIAIRTRVSTEPAPQRGASGSATASASAPVATPTTAPSATPATQPSPPVMASDIQSAKPAPTARPPSSVRVTPPPSTVRSTASDDDFSPTMKRP